MPPSLSVAPPPPSSAAPLDATARWLSTAAMSEEEGEAQRPEKGGGVRAEMEKVRERTGWGPAQRIRIREREMIFLFVWILFEAT